MPILIIESDGRCQAGLLAGRVLVGRWPNNTIVIDDRSVSRIHAWFGEQDGRYYVADAGSRTGTFVNNEPLTDRHVLYDNDRIRVGPVTLRYRSETTIPHDCDEVDLSPRPPEELSGDHGVFMDCACGAPLWMPLNFAGVGQCRYCGHTVSTTGAALNAPEVGEAVARAQDAGAGDDDDDFDAVLDDAFRKPAAPGAASAHPHTAVQVCGVCHSAIADFEEITHCPSCGLTFHADCWTENRGCSAYGCAQVGALDAVAE